MNKDLFKEIYSQSRNGCESFTRHPLVRSFAFSDGVKDLADTGCWWLLDILATELPVEFRRQAEVSNRCIVHVSVKQGTANLRAEFEDDVVAWKRSSIHTDLPDGEWVFMVADEYTVDAPYRMILISEY